MNKKLIFFVMFSTTFSFGMHHTKHLKKSGKPTHELIKKTADQKDSERALAVFCGYGTSAACFIGAAVLTAWNIPEIPEVLCIQGFLAGSVITGLIIQHECGKKNKPLSNKKYMKLL